MPASHPIRDALADALSRLGPALASYAAGGVLFFNTQGLFLWRFRGEPPGEAAPFVETALARDLTGRAFIPALRAYGAEDGSFTFDRGHAAVWGGKKLLAWVRFPAAPGLEPDPLFALFRAAEAKASLATTGLLLLPEDAETSAHERLQSVHDRRYVEDVDVEGLLARHFEFEGTDRVEINAVGPLSAAWLGSEHASPAASALRPGSEGDARWAALLGFPRLTPVQREIFRLARRGTLRAWDRRGKDPRETAGRRIHSVPRLPLRALQRLGLVALRPGVPTTNRDGDWNSEYWAVGPARRLDIREADILRLRELLTRQEDPDAATVDLRDLPGLDRLHRALGVLAGAERVVVPSETAARVKDARRPRRILLSRAEARALLTGRKRLQFVPDSFHFALSRARENPALSDPARFEPGTPLFFEIRRGRRRVLFARARPFGRTRRRLHARETWMAPRRQFPRPAVEQGPPRRVVQAGRLGLAPRLRPERPGGIRDARERPRPRGTRRARDAPCAAFQRLR